MIETVLMSVLAVASPQATGEIPAPGMSANVRPPELNGAGVEAKLNQPVPLALGFRDETGKDVTLGDYFQPDRPVILVLAYYRCPMLCSQVIGGLFDSLRGVDLPRDRYEVLVVSFDAREKPDLAAAKRASYLEQYPRPGAAQHIHFLTGEQPAIDELTKAVGFGYSYDAAKDQFAHPGMLTVLTPEGTIARYFFGISFRGRDLRLGLVEASQGKIGTTLDQVVLFCLAYDPARGGYAASVLNLVRLGGAVTVAVIVTAVVVARRRERRRMRQLNPATGV